MSSRSMTLYERKDLLRQAKNEIRHDIAFSFPFYLVYLVFSVYIDYISIYQFEDLVLRTSEDTAIALSIGSVFCIDVLIPVLLTKVLVKANFNQKKVNLVLIFSILFSIGIPLLLMTVQKLLGVEIMIPDRGTTTVISQNVKIVTQLLFSMVPLATTTGLTVMGLLREYIKIFRKYRYLQLAEARLIAQENEGIDACQTDESHIIPRDDSRLLSTALDILTKVDSLFTKSREILAEDIDKPDATEKILQSQPVYKPSRLFTHFKDIVYKNPALNVNVEDNTNTEKSVSTASTTNVTMSAFEKEENHHEKESA